MTLREAFLERLPAMGIPGGGAAEVLSGAGAEWYERASGLRESGEGEQADHGRAAPESAGLSELIRAMPREPAHMLDTPLHLLDVPVEVVPIDGVAGTGAGEYVYVTIGVGETHVAVYDADGVCERHAVVDSGWAVGCRFPLSHGGRIHYATSTEQMQRAMEGRLQAYGEPVNTSGLVSFMEKHVRRVVEFALDETVGAALTYKEIVLSGPPFLLAALESSGSLRPHIRVDVDNGA